MFCNVCQEQKNQKVGKDDDGGLERIKGRNKWETRGALYDIHAWKHRKEQENKQGVNENVKQVHANMSTEQVENKQKK